MNQILRKFEWRIACKKPGGRTFHECLTPEASRTLTSTALNIECTEKDFPPSRSILAAQARPTFMLRPPDSQKAFTLIEVMMAASVLLVGIFGMIYAVSMCSEMLDTAKRSHIALQIIDGEISRMRVADWGTGPSGIAGTVSYSADSASATDFKTIVVDANGTATGLGGDSTQKLAFALTNFTTSNSDDNNALLNLARGFTVQMNVSSPRANEYRIFSYIVKWTNMTGKSHSRHGTTYIGRYGLAASYKR